MLSRIDYFLNELQKSNTTARWYGGLSQISAIDHLKWRANDLNDYQPYDSCRINEEWPIRGPITVLVISEMIFLSPSVLKLPFLSQHSAFFSFVLALSNKWKEERKAKREVVNMHSAGTKPNAFLCRISFICSNLYSLWFAEEVTMKVITLDCDSHAITSSSRYSTTFPNLFIFV